eukprot:COSAG06_NODE_5033_length_3775_cov_1.484222_1_plen_157_part_00
MLCVRPPPWLWSLCVSRARPRLYCWPPGGPAASWILTRVTIKTHRDQGGGSEIGMVGNLLGHATVATAATGRCGATSLVVVHPWCNLGTKECGTTYDQGALIYSTGLKNMLKETHQSLTVARRASARTGFPRRASSTSLLPPPGLYTTSIGRCSTR